MAGMNRHPVSIPPTETKVRVPLTLTYLPSYSPQLPDGTWPCEEVRDIIEEIQSFGIENGLRIGKCNQRGVIMRGKGGKQEWDLAKKYRALADQVRTSWPRTAGILDSLAKGYEGEAKEWDKQAEWEEY